MQKNVELPRPLETYLAFAEGERGRDCRRFSITLSYLDCGRMDKLQWWWRLGETEESLLGADGIEARRRRETERFLRHIERWLSNNARSLHGEGPFPCLSALPVAESNPVTSTEPLAPPLAQERVANG
jgi:hypothetical protein